MKTESIIEGLNRHIEERRKLLDIKVSGHLVLQKMVNPNNMFKAYKEYTWLLWFVKNNERYKILDLSSTSRVVDGREDEAIKSMNVALCKSIFDIFNTETYNKVITGEYYGNNNE